MKRIILSLIIICSFLTFGSLSVFSQGVLSSCNFPPQCQEVPFCTDTVDCFKFDLYTPKPLAGDPTKSVIKIMVTNYSESTLTHVAFELPNGVPASQPANNTVFRNRYNHDVFNPYNPAIDVPGPPPMQTSIMFRNRLATGGTFSYGGFEVYYFVVNTADLNSDRIMRVAARAGRPYQQLRKGDLFFNFDNCNFCPPPVNEICEKTDCCFNYLFLAETNFADPTQTTVGFDVTNLCGNEVTAVKISLPAGTDTGPALGPISNNTAGETFTPSTTPTQLTFTATPGAPAWDAAGEFAHFQYNISTALVKQPGNSNVTITVVTTAGSYAQTFNIINPECGIPLPVAMLNFDGKAIKEGIALNWRTATEKNNDRFEVQRSIDGQNFEKIGTVKGNGTSNMVREYGFVDKQPLAGQNYYRLNQVDFDGSNAYSKVIQVNSGEQAPGHTVQLIPNPCRGENCAVQLTGFSGNNQISIELRDITGRLIFSKQLAANATSLELPKLNTENGIYILSAKDGTNVAYRKVIIQ
jgi:hypothetical protein